VCTLLGGISQEFTSAVEVREGLQGETHLLGASQDPDPQRKIIPFRVRKFLLCILLEKHLEKAS